MCDGAFVGLRLREGLCADIEGDWRIHIVSCDPRRPEVFFIAGWPYSSRGFPLHPDAPRLADIWEMGDPGKYLSPERRERLRRAVAA